MGSQSRGFKPWLCPSKFSMLWLIHCLNALCPMRKAIKASASSVLAVQHCRSSSAPATSTVRCPQKNPSSRGSSQSQAKTKPWGRAWIWLQLLEAKAPRSQAKAGAMKPSQARASL
ncbi:hypothetical protein B0H10DRAFT_2025365 [Mycena sp. CBHHK59/15]|nr:hypothetical protein B0H10DRAFT_2025365 [Mycena sp. CBHHK59/15]